MDFPFDQNLRRNNKCWCGSGLKYKKCHLKKEDILELGKHEAIRMRKEEFKNKVCSAKSVIQPDCSGKIIEAHSVSKASSLKIIARDQHVYHFYVDPYLIERKNSKLSPKLVGINKASTFNGFCSLHDKILFSSIEDKDFIGETEQCFLLAYRTLCREYYLKKAAWKSIDYCRASAKNVGLYEVRKGLIDASELGTALSVKTLGNKKHTFDDILVNKKFDKLKSIIIEFYIPPSVMASGGIYPEYSFDGLKLQNLAEISDKRDLLLFSTIGNKSGGAFVMSWLEEDNQACDLFVKSLKEKQTNKYSNYIIRMLFEHCENIYLSPLWWDGLNAKTKENLIDKMMYTMNPMNQRLPNCLVEDGIHYDEWKVEKIKGKI